MECTINKNMWSVPWYSVLSLKAYFSAVFFLLCFYIIFLICFDAFVQKFFQKQNPFHSISDIRKTFHFIIICGWMDWQCRPDEIMHTKNVEWKAWCLCINSFSRENKTIKNGSNLDLIVPTSTISMAYRTIWTNKN